MANAGTSGSTPVAGAGGTLGMGGDGAQNGASGAAGETGVVQGRIEVVSLYREGADLVKAQFFLPRDDFFATCQGQTIGSCTLYVCPPDAPPSNQIVPSAGPIQVSAVYPPMPANVITASLTPDAMGKYDYPDLSGTLFGDETITVTAAGAEIPAFQGTLTFPLQLIFSAPLPTPQPNETSLSLVVSRQQDTQLTWERGADGVGFRVAGFADPQYFECLFPSLDGAGTIPAALVQSFPESKLYFYTMASTTVLAGDHPVEIQATAEVTTPSKMQSVDGLLQ